MAVLMPQQVALVSTRAPPELPGLMAASVWNEVLEGVDTELVASERADDAAGDGLTDAEGVADGQHLVAHLQVVGIAQHDHRQLVEFDLEHGQVAVGVVRSPWRGSGGCR